MSCFRTYRLRALAGAAIFVLFTAASPALAGPNTPAPHVHETPGHGDPDYGGPRADQNDRRARHCSRCRETIEQVWVPGAWDVHRERYVCEPGQYATTHVPAVYETRYDDRGTPYEVQVRPERHRRIWAPRRCDWRERKVWVPGYWKEVRAHECKARRRPRWEWGYRFGLERSGLQRYASRTYDACADPVTCG